MRFASVYRDFREAADFHEVLGEIAERDKAVEEAGAAAPKPLAVEAADRKH